MSFVWNADGRFRACFILASVATIVALAPPAYAQDGYAGYRERLKAVKSVDTSAQVPAQVSPRAAPCTILEKVDAAHYYRTRSPRSIEATLADFIVFNPNRDTLWPGALLRWSSLESGNPALINVPRTPVDIWLDVSHGKDIARDGVQPRAASVATAINALLKENTSGYAAGVDFDFAEVQSVQQALLQLGLSAEWLSGATVAAVTERRISTNHLTLVKFTQIYYTVSYGLPSAGNHAVIAPALDAATLDDVFDPKDPPVYVSQVNYGRTFLFRLELIS